MGMENINGGTIPETAGAWIRLPKSGALEQFYGCSDIAIGASDVTTGQVSPNVPVVVPKGDVDDRKWQELVDHDRKWQEHVNQSCPKFHWANVLTKLNEDWPINVVILAFTRFQYIHFRKTVPPHGSHFRDDWTELKTTPPPGDHVFQRTKTIFQNAAQISLKRMKTDTPRHGSHVFNDLLIRKTALPRRPYNIRTNVLTKKTTSTPGGHKKAAPHIGKLRKDIFTTSNPTKGKLKPSGGHVFERTIARVLTRKTAPHPGGHVF
ncbi:hypothetical protein DPMN_154869 [Dreissena polymorpha]|uniref:Uncharacterized protein n=1 Tax=Dreissena polymorpha TaxID=45954 RepID=A0A9D4FMW4_DREPO|nr:hypothetical protein DPMN_154869 [Dreissena polymorpha]